jgi:hypothetical protein
VEDSYHKDRIANRRVRPRRELFQRLARQLLPFIIGGLDVRLQKFPTLPKPWFLWGSHWVLKLPNSPCVGTLKLLGSPRIC